VKQLLTAAALASDDATFSASVQALLREPEPLLFATACDAVVFELFTAAACAGDAVSLPPPHLYLATLVALPPGACSECAHASHSLCLTCQATNPLLFYMRLREAEAAGPLRLRSLACAALAKGVTPGPPETRRGRDPLGCAALRAWQAAVRDRVAAWTAFACPNAAAVAALATFAPAAGVLELGAGTGYWAAFLRRRGLAVVAADIKPPGRRGKGANEYHGSLPAWGVVQAGDAVGMARSHGRGRLLLLCYAPPPAPGRPCVALAAVRAFASAGGTRLALVGEFRGDTASAAFEQELAQGWELVKTVPLPNYANTVASLTLWQKGMDSASWPLRCIACGAMPAAANGCDMLLRDRLTRSIFACSKLCTQSALASEALETELAARHLPPLVSKDGLPWAWEQAGVPLWRKDG